MKQIAGRTGVVVWLLAAVLGVGLAVVIVVEPALKEAYWAPVATLFVAVLWAYHRWRSPRASVARRVAKWAALAMCVLLAAGLVFQVWHTVAWTNSYGTGVRLMEGQVQIGWMRVPQSGTARFVWRLDRARPVDFRTYWQLPLPSVYGDYVHLPVSLLPLLVLLASLTFVLWLRDRLRFAAGYCPKCGYDLTGNVSGRCPECGARMQRAGIPPRGSTEGTSESAGH